MLSPIDTSFSVYSDFPPEVLKHFEDIDNTLRKRSGALTLSQLKKQNTEHPEQDGKRLERNKNNKL